MADDNTTNLVGTLVGAYVAVKVIDAIGSKKPKKSKNSFSLFGKQKKIKSLF